MKPYKKPIFWKSQFSFSCLVILSVIFFFRDGLPKKEMNKVNGAITFLSDSYKNTDERHAGKMRFFMVGNSHEVFEVFIGKESGDFSPDLEKMDQLRKGDVIDIYYPDAVTVQKDEINRSVLFIDKDNKPVFIQGNIGRLMSVYIIGFCLLCMGILLPVLKSKGYIS